MDNLFYQCTVYTWCCGTGDNCFVWAGVELFQVGCGLQPYVVRAKANQKTHQLLNIILFCLDNKKTLYIYVTAIYIILNMVVICSLLVILVTPLLPDVHQAVLGHHDNVLTRSYF